MEEDKKAREEPKRAEAFTELPASSNQKLMDFEAQLLMKAGKQPTVASTAGAASLTVAQQQ